MEEKQIILKPKKDAKVNLGKLTQLFENKKRRYLIISLIMIPLLLAIAFLGYSIYKDVMNIINMAKGNVETNDEHIIESMNYILRVDPTDIQAEYFAELKKAIEEDNADDATIAGLVAKNYVTDFYTWSNKRGQYDVGGMYYVYTPLKKDIYIQARDEFYKYINHYINEYGVENLIEVESVEVVDVKKADFDYVLHETVTTTVEVEKEEESNENNTSADTSSTSNTSTNTQETTETVEEEVETETITEEIDKNYKDAYLVTCTWTYKEKEGNVYNPSKLAKKMNFLVVKNGNRFEIVEADTAKIEVETVEESEEEQLEQNQGNA